MIQDTQNHITYAPTLLKLLMSPSLTPLLPIPNPHTSYPSPPPLLCQINHHLPFIRLISKSYNLLTLQHLPPTGGFWFSRCKAATAAIIAGIALWRIAAHPTSTSPSYARTIIATCLFNFKMPQFTYSTAPSVNCEFWLSICLAATAAIVANVAACSIVTPPPPPMLDQSVTCLFNFKVPQFTYFTAPSANSEFWFSTCLATTAAIVADVAAPHHPRLPLLCLINHRHLFIHFQSATIYLLYSTFRQQ